MSGNELMQSQTTDLVSQLDAVIAPLLVGQPALRLAHNLTDLQPMERTRILGLALGKSDLSRDDLTNRTIDVRHWVAHVVPVVDDETGVAKPAIRVVLITPEGITAGFVSSGVAHSLRLIIDGVGAGPWNPPLKLRVVTQSTRAGRQVVLLQLAENGA